MTKKLREYSFHCIFSNTFDVAMFFTQLCQNDKAFGEENEVSILFVWYRSSSYICFRKDVSGELSDVDAGPRDIEWVSTCLSFLHTYTYALCSRPSFKQNKMLKTPKTPTKSTNMLGMPISIEK